MNTLWHLVAMHPISSKQRKQSTVDPLFTKTTPEQKRKLDLSIARYFYSSNTPFRDVENEEFQDMIKALHPGYPPPNRAHIDGNLLNSVNSDFRKTTAERLTGQLVSLSVACWTNVNNKSILGFCIQDYQKTYIVSIKDASDKNHISEFFCENAQIVNDKGFRQRAISKTTFETVLAWKN